jgi:hypothetical protein
MPKRWHKGIEIDFLNNGEEELNLDYLGYGNKKRKF